MYESKPVLDWVLVVVLYLALPLLLVALFSDDPRARRRRERIADWFGRHAHADPDAVAPDLAEAVRRRRLTDDLARLEHLLATDRALSPTRQRALRLAYAEVRAQLAPLGPGWAAPGRPALGPPRTAPPETLDIRW